MAVDKLTLKLIKGSTVDFETEMIRSAFTVYFKKI